MHLDLTGGKTAEHVVQGEPGHVVAVNVMADTVAMLVRSGNLLGDSELTSLTAARGALSCHDADLAPCDQLWLQARAQAA